MATPQPHDVEYFATPAEFRTWLEANHATRTELWAGFHKKSSGKPSLTWSEAVDQALCFGWIDGIRVSIDGERYANRFTPRRLGSTWSAVNLKKVADLKENGLMTPAGLAAYEARRPEKTQRYSYDGRDIPFDEASEERFRSNPGAWAFFQCQAPGYRRTAGFWVMGAKREETRRSRLAQLIEDSANGRWIKQLNRPSRKS